MEDNLNTDDTGRREFIKTIVGIGCVISAPETAFSANEKPPKKMRPQEGDRLTFRKGKRKGEIIREEDVPLNGPVVTAFPQDPETGVIRKESRLNQVILVRLEPDVIKESSQPNAANGIVAYSAICTHKACIVDNWDKRNSQLMCMCHGSRYDPTDKAKALKGPAIRRLPSLPIKIEEGEIIVSGTFDGKVGR